MRVNRHWPLRAMALILGLILGACFMPHGYPPWSGIKKQTVFTLPLDLAEHAARLGSIVTYDRRGDVIAMLTFDQGLQGAPTGVDHVDSVAILSTDTALSGPWSLKLDPRGVDNAYANWRKLVFPLTVGKVGAEFAFSLQPDPALIYFRLQYFSGTHRYPGWLTYYPATGAWKILKADGTEETIFSGLIVQTGFEAWHYAKIVIDTEKREYLRVMVDDNAWAAAGYGLQEIESDAKGVIEVKVEVGGSSTANAPCYLDSVIITQNEPGLRG